VRPVLRTAWPVLLVTAVLLLFVWPWGNRTPTTCATATQQRSDLSRVAPGVFQTSSDGKRVFFVEREGADTINAATSSC
jgi:lipopolysaccharide export system permease protein